MRACVHTLVRAIIHRAVLCCVVSIQKVRRLIVHIHNTTGHLCHVSLPLQTSPITTSHHHNITSLLCNASKVSLVRTYLVALSLGDTILHVISQTSPHLHLIFTSSFQCNDSKISLISFHTHSFRPLDTIEVCERACLEHTRRYALRGATL